MAIKFAPAGKSPAPVSSNRVKTIDGIKAAVTKSEARKKPSTAQKTKIVADELKASAPTARGRPPVDDKQETISIRLPRELVTKIKSTKDWKKIAKSALDHAFKIHTSVEMPK